MRKKAAKKEPRKKLSISEYPFKFVLKETITKNYLKNIPKENANRNKRNETYRNY